jgi:hypothetical protein
MESVECTSQLDEPRREVMQMPIGAAMLVFLIRVAQGQGLRRRRRW